MNKLKMLELMVSLHKKVDVNALSDDGWREYQRERQDGRSHRSWLRKKNAHP